MSKVLARRPSYSDTRRKTEDDVELGLQVTGYYSHRPRRWAGQAALDVVRGPVAWPDVVYLRGIQYVRVYVSVHPIYPVYPYDERPQGGGDPSFHRGVYARE